MIKVLNLITDKFFNLFKLIDPNEVPHGHKVCIECEGRGTEDGLVPCDSCEGNGFVSIYEN